MSHAIRNVLAVALPAEHYSRFKPLLKRESFAVDRVPSIEGARALIEAVAFDIIVISFPLPGSAFERLIELIRREGSPCRRSAALVLAPPDRVAEAEAHATCGFTRVLSTEAPKRELEEAITALLRVAPRLSVRLSIRLVVELGDGTTQTLCQTENVSRGGMLVRSHRIYPVDSPVRFELTLPDEEDPVVGRGVIVRHTADSKLRDNGFGVKLLDYDGDGQSRLAGFIRLALDKESRTSLFPGIGG